MMDDEMLAYGNREIEGEISAGLMRLEEMLG
jgi:hypothetical protein